MDGAHMLPRQPGVENIDELEKCLREAEASGEPVEMNDAEWHKLYDQIEQDALRRRKAS